MRRKWILIYCAASSQHMRRKWILINCEASSLHIQMLRKWILIYCAAPSLHMRSKQILLYCATPFCTGAVNDLHVCNFLLCTCAVNEFFYVGWASKVIFFKISTAILPLTHSGRHFLNACAVKLIILSNSFYRRIRRLWSQACPHSKKLAGILLCEKRLYNYTLKCTVHNCCDSF
jgi:hypothetical protein